MNRLIRCISAALSCALLFCSCSSAKEKYALYGQYPNGKIRAYMTEGMFRYYLSQQKAIDLQVIMYNDKTVTGDSEEIWQRTSPDGKVYEDTFFSEAVKEATELCAANYLLYSFPSASDPNKSYTLPEDYLDYVDSLIAQNAAEKYGSLAAFEDYLLNFGATLKDYTDLYIMTANVDLVKDAIFADNGIRPITDDDIRSYYAENYYSVRHIFVNTAYDEKIDGTRAPLSEAESKKRTETAQSIFAFISAGGSFEEAAQRFTESYVTAYSTVNQMDISAQTANAPELGEALKQMQLDEVRTVRSAYGIHIIKRVETDPNQYNRDETVVSNITAALKNALYPEIIARYTPQIVTNGDIIGKYSMATAQMP